MADGLPETDDDLRPAQTTKPVKTAQGIRDTEERQAFLLKLSDALRSVVEPESIQQIAVQLTSEHLDVGRVLYAEIHHAPEITVVVGRDWPRRDMPSVAEGTFRMDDFGPFLAQALTAGRPATVADATTDPRLTQAERAMWKTLHIVSTIGVPVMRDGRLVAIVGAQDNRPHAWSDAERTLLTDIGDRVWEANERTRAEAALRQSEEKYRMLFESMDEGYAVVEVLRDDNDRVVDVLGVDINRAYTEKSGIPASFVGRRFSEFSKLEDYWLDIYDKVSRTGEAIRVENYWADHDRWLTGNFSRVGGDGSNLVAIVFDDVTARKKAEISLRESQELKTYLLELSDTLRSLSDPEDIQHEAMRLLGERLGLSRAQYYTADETGEYLSSTGGYTDGVPAAVGRFRLIEFGQYAYDGFHAGETQVVCDARQDPRISEAVLRSYETVGFLAFIGVPFVQRGRLLGTIAAHQAGPRQWTESERVMVEETAVRAGTAVEQARTEAALRDSEARWRLLADAMPNLVWIADACAGTFVYVNDEFRRFTGYEAESTSGWTQIVHPDDRDMVEAQWRRSHARRSIFDVEVRLRRHDGEYRWHQARAVPAPNDDGRSQLWFGACTDIQNLMEARFQAESADRAKSEFLANMSHEIRTPLNAVVGLTSIMLRFNPEPEMQAKYLQTMQDSANNLTELIDDVLEYAKIDANMVELHESEVDLHDLLDEVMRIAAVKAEQKGLAIDLHDRLERRAVIADGHRIKQILLNLLSNAVKFTDRGTISILVTRRKADSGRDMIAITVKDTGIGIAPDKLDMIFDKFTQADYTITRRFGGTGLGLAISRRLAETMGGTLKVQSELHKGSQFMLTLPLRVAGVQAAPEAARPVAHSEPLHILLVEDNPTNAMVALTMLQKLGHTCEAATNGFEAIEAWRSGRFDVVLMDLQMPDMDGVTAARRIRQMESDAGQAHVRIVAMTAHALKSDRERAMAAGMDDFMSKPFKAEELREKLEV